MHKAYFEKHFDTDAKLPFVDVCCESITDKLDIFSFTMI